MKKVMNKKQRVVKWAKDHKRIPWSVMIKELRLYVYPNADGKMRSILTQLKNEGKVRSYTEVGIRGHKFVQLHPIM